VTYAVDGITSKSGTSRSTDVLAFAGLVETMADYTGRNPSCRDAIPQRIAARINGLTDGRQTTDDVLTEFADELHRAELWGLERTLRS